jgi:putative MATE family efflux protein
MPISSKKNETDEISFIQPGENLGKNIWKLTLPALVELLLGTLFGMVDMIMVGNINTQSLAAVGLTNQPMMLALAVFQSLNVGSMALVARFVGNGDKKNAEKVVRQTIIMTVFMGIVVSIIGFIFAGSVADFMGAEPDVLPLATGYLKIISLGGLFISTTMGIGASLRGAGDTISPMRYNVITNLLNVVLNYVLIYGKFGFPAMGVNGAALATTISRGIAMIMAFAALYHQDSIIRPSKQRNNYNLDIAVIRKILKIGIPSGLEQFALRTGQIEFARTVAGLGTTVFAAHQIGINVFGLSFAPSMAFGMAATTLVGQSLGAKRLNMAQKYGLETRRRGMFVAAAIASLFFFFGRQIAGLYTNDHQVIILAVVCLKIIAIIQPLQSTQFILAGALRGAGDTRWPLYSTFIGVWGVRIVLTKLFINMGWGLTGAWIAQGCDQVFRSIFIYQRYKSGKWKKIRV